MESFLFDWGVADHGHYNNLVQPGVTAQKAYKDVGIGLVNTSGNGVGPLVITTDFGAEQNEGPQIVGVVYNDKNHDNFYNPGEGEGGVTITATDSNGKAYSMQTWQSGGYQLAVPTNMDYTVTASVNGQVLQTQQVHVSDVNVKTDFILDPSQSPAAPTPVASRPRPQPRPRPPLPPPRPRLPPDPGPHAGRSSSTSGRRRDPDDSPAPSAPAAPSWLSGWSQWKAIDGTSNNS